MKFTDDIFTKRTRTTKCATLELSPTGRTRETIDELDLIAKDMVWSKREKDSEKYIDKYLVEQINAILSDLSDKCLRDNLLEDEKTDLKKEVVACIKECDSLKKFGSAEWLFETKSEDALPNWLINIGDTEGAEVMQGMKGTAELYSTFITNRLTALNDTMPKRVEENFELYKKNIPAVKLMIESDCDYAVKNEEMLSIYSSVAGYTYCLTSEGIEAYNKFVSGTVSESGIDEIGFNGFVNEYNQQITKKDKSTKNLKKIKGLYKQVLIPREKMFSISRIENNDELIDVLRTDVEAMMPACAQADSDFAENITEDTVIFEKSLHYLSHYLFNDHNKLKSYIEKFKDYFTLKELSDMSGEDIIAILIAKSNELWQIENALGEELEESGIYECNNIRNNDKYRKMIINYTNSVKAYKDFIRLFVCDSDNNSLFNLLCADIYEDLGKNYKATNLMRNYITKKIGNEAVKTRIFFDTPLKLGAMWYKDVTGKKLEKDKNALILRDGKYYMVTLCPDTKPVKLERPTSDEDTCYLCAFDKPQKSFMLLPQATFCCKGGPKNFFENNGGSTFVLKNGFENPVVITKEQYEIYKSGSFKKSEAKKLGLTDEEFKKNLVKILTLYKKVALNLTAWQNYDLSGIRDIESYNDAGEFFNDIDRMAVAAIKEPISFNQIEKLVEDGKALMFLIKNQKMYEEDKTKTSYAEIFLAFFSEENIKHTSLILNSKPAFYFRPAIIEPTIAHPKGSQLVNKIDNDGNIVPTDIYTELYHYFNGRLELAELSDAAREMKDKVGHHDAPWDLYKKSRYARDMFTITFSYTVNRDIDRESIIAINDDINDVLEYSGNKLAIMRGTDILLYYSLFDNDMNVITEGSLDKIGNVDFGQRLKMLSKQRKSEKAENWKYDTTVAEVKDDFIKKAVAEIGRIAVENNAIILVDTIGDKDRAKWSCLDNQIFGRFVDALCKKMADYHIKGAKGNEAGSVLNPLQLARIPDTKNTAWQQGIVYMVNSTYIRNVDDKTGFINIFDLSNLNSLKKQKAFFEKFDSIKMTDEDIRFTFNYDNFETRKVTCPQRQWSIVISNDTTRTFYNKEAKVNKTVNHPIDWLKKGLKELKCEIENGDIIAQLENFNRAGMNLFMEVFKNTLFGVVKTPTGNIKISATTGEVDYNPYNTNAKMLVDKYEYSEEYKEKLNKIKETKSKESLDYTGDWLSLRQTS